MRAKRVCGASLRPPAVQSESRDAFLKRQASRTSCRYPTCYTYSSLQAKEVLSHVQASSWS